MAIKVSVLIITYNHENFIIQALDSVLMQQTNFVYEIVIGEDCSTDSTCYILQDYRQRYPDIIKLLINKKNLGMTQNFEQTLLHCQGQYVALLEGDDYWSSKHKLQKQVDFLDNHPECVICFHNTQVIYQDKDRSSHNYPASEQKQISDLTDLLKNNFLATPSVMFRRGLFDYLPSWFHNLKMGDWTLHILNAQFGKIGYINQVMATYRVHSMGVWSSTSYTLQLRRSIDMLNIINHHFGFKYNRLISYSILKHYQKLVFSSLEKLQIQDGFHYFLKVLQYTIKYLINIK